MTPKKTCSQTISDQAFRPPEAASLTLQLTRTATTIAVAKPRINVPFMVLSGFIITPPS